MKVAAMSEILARRPPTPVSLDADDPDDDDDCSTATTRRLPPGGSPRGARERRDDHEDELDFDRDGGHPVHRKIPPGRRSECWSTRI